MRINNESFEKVLKEKYGIYWSIDDGFYMSAYGLTFKWRASEHELIGIIVGELFKKTYNFHLCINGSLIEIGLGEPTIDNKSIGSRSLYEALKKAVEAIEW